MHEVYGTEFEELYISYEKQGRARKTIPAQKLWYAILEARIETGGQLDPSLDLHYLLLDKSNRKNLGSTKSSNLCTEIIEYPAPYSDETALCY